jgi:hypothetical protein
MIKFGCQDDLSMSSPAIRFRNDFFFAHLPWPSYSSILAKHRRNDSDVDRCLLSLQNLMFPA